MNTKDTFEMFHKEKIVRIANGCKHVFENCIIYIKYSTKVNIVKVNNNKMGFSKKILQISIGE